MNKTVVRSILSGLPKFVLPLFVLLIVQIGANAQSYTPNEQACYDMVQGKVAYDRAGNKSWNEGNVRQLCKGTVNPSATIDCFSQRVINYDDWARGVRECTAAALASTAPTKVVRDTSNQAPPNFTYCADDFQKCAFDGDREVIYGANGVFTRKVLTGGFVCLPSAFGIDDPLPGVLKKCYVSNVTPAATATVSRTISVKNSSAVALRAYLVDRQNADNTNPNGEIPFAVAKIEIGPGYERSLGTAMPKPVTEDVQLIIRNSSSLKPLFVAVMPKNGRITNFCYEVTGTDYVIDVKTCDGSPTYEQKYILFRNEAGYHASMGLSYYQVNGTVAKNVTTGTTILGQQRKIYLPVNANTSGMTLQLRDDIGNRQIMLKSVKLEDFDASGIGCFKAWGSLSTPKTSPCALNTNARSVKFWNSAGYPAMLKVTYYDKVDGKDVGRTVATNRIELTQTDTIEVPAGSSNTPVKIEFFTVLGTSISKLFHTLSTRADFSGELCYKVEGTAFAPTAASCDNVVGDTTGSSTRQLRFQNDAGFDAQMVVTYFVNQSIGGQVIAMPKVVSTGMINGLGDKFRIVNIPKKLPPNTEVMINLQGSTTLRNEIWSTKLPGNFSSNPHPCFKVWGTLFDPQGGKCDD